MTVLHTYLTPKERVYQENVLAIFSELKYRYLGNFLYQRNAREREDGVKNSPIIEGEVEAYLRDAGYTEMQIGSAIAQLKEKAYLPHANMGSLLQVNNDFYNVLVDGVKCKPAADKNEENVYFINFKDYGLNRFAIAEEVSYYDGLTGEGSRPDLVVYVNGIAVAVIELKRSTVSLDEGIKQMLSNEADLIPSFFTTVQYTIAASSGNGFSYGTIDTPKKFWCPFKSDGQKVGDVLTDKESFRLFFAPKTFIDLLRYGVVNDGGVKKVMRPHQYYALVHAMPRMKDKQSGVIWHSQGSGKSLTMIWLASYIKANFSDPRVLVITDRTELDIQIKNGFVKAGEAVGHAKTSDHLLDMLNGGEEWLICSLIHKFGRHADEQNDDNDVKIRLDKYLDELRDLIKSKYPQGFSVKGENIFVFVDECHRTQGGMLHEAMKEILGKEVMLVGFTGTPQLKSDKRNGYEDFARTSEVKFGPFIHKYLHKEAVADKVILDLQYEARDVEQEITNKAKLDSIKDNITSGLTEERARMIDRRWATLQNVFSSKERIERISYSIIDDVRYGMLGQDWCNAMLVAGDIYSAYRYYDFLQNKCPDKILKGRCAVVTSYSPSANDIRKETNDPNEVTRNQFKHDMALQSYKDASEVSNKPIKTNEKYEEWAKYQFIHFPGRMKLLIVVDKLLTGFDAPCATYLYIDRDMRDHDLFQSLCRVNRLGTDLLDPLGKQIISHKEFGLIVDFKHLFSKISEAVTDFNDEHGGLGNYDPKDLEGLLTDAVEGYRKKLLATYKVYIDLKTKWESLGLTDMDALKSYYLKDEMDGDAVVLSAEEKRNAMYKIIGDFVVAYSAISNYIKKAGFTDDEANMYERNAREASQIRETIKQVSGDAFDPRQYDPAMQDLLDRFMHAEEVETIIEKTSDFSFLDLLSDSDNVKDVVDDFVGDVKDEESAAELIEGKVRRVINSYRTKDPELYLRFSEQLQGLLDQLKNDRANFVERATALIELAKEAKKGGNHYPDGVKTQVARALWNNRKDIFQSVDDVTVVKAIEEIEDFVENETYRGWQDPMSKSGYCFFADFQDMYPKYSDEQITMIHRLAAENY